ncbi:hypothetical protein [Agromyces larvae]|uniref:Uncharacterized protein n=1 Tax=Agromyces larvae TaxID=2929802 RepID=A0ABY4C356_9MICO|nr:hypothetical protein [Agromyces larvae]UOE45908.1 hypothetical protein MTO99_09255 [Agromyces larvae]
MSVTIPIPVHPWPLTPERLALLKQAKAAIDVPFKIVPVESVPGSPGNVLAFGELPPHLCSVALIRPENVDNPASVLAALRAVLTSADGLFDEADYLAALLPGTREVTDPLELLALDDLLEERAMRREAVAA